MKAKTHQISWHYEQDAPKPVFAVDFHAEQGPGVYRLATAGGDRTVKIWRVTATPDGDTHVTFLAELRHQSTVNCVRFAPHGYTLASADDDGLVLVWTCDEPAPLTENGTVPPPLDASAGSSNVASGSGAAPSGPTSALGSKQSPAGLAPSATSTGTAVPTIAETNATSTLLDGGEAPEQLEQWRTTLRLRRHDQDVYDLAWAPDGRYLVSGSVDNSAIIWDAQDGHVVSQMKDHRSYVQGVAWSPRGDKLFTQSADRSLKVFKARTTKKGTLQVQQECTLSTLATPNKRSDDTDNVTKTPTEGDEPPVESSAANAPRLFVDVTKTTFFRRGHFSPDGTLILATAGQSVVHTGKLAPVERRWPVLEYPTDETAVVARFSPCVYAQRTHGVTAMFTGLQHRLVWAIASKETVFFYDSQQQQPFAAVLNLHLAPISDVAWSHDGRLLVVASEDGFCSIVGFKANDLGEKVALEMPVPSSPVATQPPPTTQPNHKIVPLDCERGPEPAKTGNIEGPSTSEESTIDKDKANAKGRAIMKRIVPQVLVTEPTTSQGASTPATTTTNTKAEASASGNPGAKKPRRIVPMTTTTTTAKPLS
ncbi:uncharacterized protein MONBRDRAFT_30450 [Monosiga brevicollis MX1]|uniref:CAF1B/HIR1 beta-propeller domain-containing protein n=1 Tax=Monosiga brevicollis TaxID=81824 RepID=A9VDZ9_MONBE|nr:uncharacterized protein MONBRDRAFT_30450 [Monosiga brevicollis MX1]EDQ84238.1 predicted protein [Monosiga brevicollis MX1]|eukprot:XP_001750962.1 hypothetical protein [Monosiga brevicollis MX1]